MAESNEGSGGGSDGSGAKPKNADAPRPGNKSPFKPIKAPDFETLQKGVTGGFPSRRKGDK